MILPLAPTFVTPNHLTTVRLIVGLACAYAFAIGSQASINVGALLLVISNVIDHADGELARVTGKTSRFGHFYDLAADALVTVLLFVGIGAGVAASSTSTFAAHGTLYGTLSGLSVAAIFYMRMKIEDAAGKAGTKLATFSIGARQCRSSRVAFRRTSNFLSIRELTQPAWA